MSIRAHIRALAPPPTSAKTLPRRTPTAALVLFLLLACGLLAGAGPAEGALRNYRILVLHSYHQGYTWTANINQGIQAELERQLPGQYELFVEYMDTKRYPPAKIFTILESMFQHKYADGRFDLVLTSDDNALRFLMTYGDDLFPGTHKVFCGVNSTELARQALDRGIPGVLDVKNIAGTLEAALNLVPSAKNVAVVSGSSTTAGVLFEQFKGIRSRFEDRAAFTVLDNLNEDEFEQRLQELPPDSIVLLLSLFSTRDGALFTLQSGVDFVSRTSNRPIFILNDNYLGSGVAGGVVINGAMQGEIAVTSGLDLLNGRRAEDVGLHSADVTTPMFDYEALARFDLKEANLPADSVVINRPYSPYEEYKPLIGAAILLILAQCLTIIALVLSRLRRKKAEEAIRVSEEKYRKIFETANEGICIFDKDMRFNTINPALVRMLGYDAPEELLGRPVWSIIHPDELDDHHDLIATRKTGVSSNYTRRMLHRNGSTVWTNVSGTPLIDENGVFTGTIGMITDITNLHLAQQALRKAYDEMEQRVIDRTSELQQSHSNLEIEIQMRKEAETAHLKAKIRAEEASRAKSDFLANMSHEIRTPINAVIGMSHLLKRTELNGTQKDYLKKLSLSAHALLGVINDILDISKVEAGMLSLESVNFRFDQVIAQVATIITPKASEKRLEFLVHLSEKVPTGLVGDPLRVTQVLMNLCNNAIKFTDEGEVVLSADVAERTDGEVRLRIGVRDTGIGIKPEHKVKLFQPFTQADVSTTRKYGGTGLGLSLCSQLTGMMGGTIGVDSEFGVGSHFWVEIPFPIGREEPESQLPAMVFRGKRALVIDDNPTSLEILSAMLTHMGFSCSTATSGYEGIGMLRGQGPLETFDIVVLDWHMPGIDGLETARLIKAGHEAELAPPIVMVTAYANDSLTLEVKELGLNGLLYKPVDPSLLHNMVQEIFSAGISPSALPPRPEPEESIDLSGVSILLVEDNEINRQVAQEILAETKATILEACDGEEALEMLDRHAPDLVLMDIHMPNMDGYEATRKLRENPDNERLPIIAMTARAMPGDKEKCLEAGMNDHIPKPFDPDDLIRIVASWLPAGTDGPQ